MAAVTGGLLAAILPELIGGLVAGGAGAAGGLLAAKKKASADKKQAEMAYGKPTEAGFEDLGSDMASDGFNRNPNLTLSNAKRPIVFNRSNQRRF